MLDSWPHVKSSSRRRTILCGIVYGQLVLALIVLIPTGTASARHPEVVLESWLALMPLAVGAALVLSTRGIDLSVGAVTGLGSMVFGAILGEGAASAFPAAIVAGVVGGVVGAVNGGLVAGLRVPSYIGTLGTAGVVSGILLMASEGRVRSIGAQVSGGGWVTALPTLAVVVVTIGLAALIAQWQDGRLERLAAGEAPAAEDVEEPATSALWVLLGIYTMAGCLAGLSGAYRTVRIAMVQPVTFVGEQTAVFAAAILGGAILFHGRGRTALSAIGAVGGALALVLAQTALTLRNVSSFAQGLILAVVLLEGGILFGIVRLVESAIDRRETDRADAMAQAPPP